MKKIQKQTIIAAQSFYAAAKKYANIPMPGYSHTQQAMLATVGHYYASFAESLLDDIDFLEAVKRHIDKNPLGSAAGYGSSLALDRQFTSAKLGFASVQINSLYCQNSRGKFESIFLEGLAQIMITLAKFAGDMLFFTSQECDFFAVPPELTTGSSIMPHKKNLDALELVRGNAKVVLAHQELIKNLAQGTLSGYNRDYQLMKGPLFASVGIVCGSLKVIDLHIQKLTPQAANIEAKIQKNIFTADVALEMVKNVGMPFRDAYKQAEKSVAGKYIDLLENIHSKICLGGPGNLCLRNYKKKIQQLRKKYGTNT